MSNMSCHVLPKSLSFCTDNSILYALPTAIWFALRSKANLPSSRLVSIFDFAFQGKGELRGLAFSKPAIHRRADRFNEILNRSEIGVFPSPNNDQATDSSGVLRVDKFLYDLPIASREVMALLKVLRRVHVNP